MIADELAEYLEDNSHGTVGTNIFVGQMTDTPMNQVVVMPTAGMAPTAVVDYQYAGVQITIRNSSFETGYTKAQAIFDLFHALTATTIESQFYNRIDALGSPAYLGQDENYNHRFTLNLIVFKAIAQV